MITAQPVEDGSGPEPLGTLLATDAIALVTLTITEAAYALDPDAPLEASALGRLLLALGRRRAASGAPIALVPCDNLAANGAALRGALAALAERHLPQLEDWLATSVSIVSTRSTGSRRDRPMPIATWSNGIAATTMPPPW